MAVSMLLAAPNLLLKERAVMAFVVLFPATLILQKAFLFPGSC